ncbi:MAG: J domain-containing protein, partial [Myxococcales bacterium]|nr:J domain-containing protein [Myxococcales bacterium]
RFTRDADDLHARVEVTIGTALLGGRVSLDSPRGRTWIRVPEGSQNGQVLRLRGKGVAGRGDLFVTLDVRLPTHLDDAAREAVRVLEAAYWRSSETVAA